ncbi:predicted protein [Methanosarcina thermophila]|uniref:Uncharacterized protein n=1 Tax=Methanosarcina thermophila TaxID=2210 RepID=A0A3G9CWZ6_METTE|nr:predicted protein [Methanosarcina thermophila]
MSLPVISKKTLNEGILDHCRKAANLDKFVKLYDKGDWRAFKYPS